MKCLKCAKQFKASRRDAVFCSDRCRVAYNRDKKRNNHVTDNSSKIIMSLCDFTGNWCEPYRKAGYTVRQADIKTGCDVRTLKFPGEIYGVLAAPPCTHFARSGARWWKSKGEQALLEALGIFDACCRIALFCNPVFWCFENPVGRLSQYVGKPKFTFNPCDYGDYGEAYTKKHACGENSMRPNRVTGWNRSQLRQDTIR